MNSVLIDTRTRQRVKHYHGFVTVQIVLLVLVLALIAPICCQLDDNSVTNDETTIDSSKPVTTKTTTKSTEPVTTKLRKNTLPRDLLESSIGIISDDDKVIDPALQRMKYNIGFGEQEVLVYVEPTIESMYQNYPINEIPSLTKVTPKYSGFAGKFINLSNQNVTLYWEGYSYDDDDDDEYESTTTTEDGRRLRPLQEVDHPGPFTASGSGTFAGQRFVFCKENDPTSILHIVTVQEYPNNVYYYDPYYVQDDPNQTNYNLQTLLTPDERIMYNKWRITIDFNKQYQQFTGRSYLANYLRQPPIHFMWPGNYFGQQHWVLTRETHFTSMPTNHELKPIIEYFDDLVESYDSVSTDTRRLEPNQPRLLQQYRETTTTILNMTLTTISVAPRVFRIDNFLSDIEVEHILELASNSELTKSLTGDNMYGKDINNTINTRTSYNSWINRNESPIIDAIYRRAADLLRIDESLFRDRYYTHHHDDEFATVVKSTEPICEELQLVHYENYQQYDAHHDFVYTDYHNNDLTNMYQGGRFATLLLYLNDDGMVGGETSFPRWVNGETFKQLKVKPVTGQAILFYSQLPDGNMDDFSQHASLPVIDGDKWLINLWVWDPLYE